MTQERAVLAGGCFWGMQDLIRRQDGVIATRVGYTGGDVPNATYRNHGTHAEAIEIIFDPAKISFRRLLELFFQIHDPTTRNRQGNDIGTSYRSAIFYTGEEQKRVAEDTIADVDASGLWPGKVVTEIAPAGDFWEAEPEHQDYLERYPDGYTCHFIRPDWKIPTRASAITVKAGEGYMTNNKAIREHMEVIGADGVHIGTVDRVEGNRIKLTKEDSGQGTHQDHHHYISTALVAEVEGDKVRLSANAAVAVSFEEEADSRV